MVANFGDVYLIEKKESEPAKNQLVNQLEINFRYQRMQF